MIAPMSALPATRHAPWLSYLCLAAAMALVGSYVGFSKLLVLVFPVFLLAWLRFGIGAIALVSVVQHADGDGAGSLWGNLLLLGAVLCEASYVVIGKKLTGNVSAKRISALVNLWGLALVTPFGVWQALGHDFARVSAPSWWLLLFYSLAASMWTVWLWMTGLKHVPAASAGVFTVLLPVSAAAVGVVF